MTDAEWYWCLQHRAVEPADGCRAEHRLGPYASYDAAAGALDTVQARNERWEREDAEYEGDADSPSVLGG